jgi:hypothetical protein
VNCHLVGVKGFITSLQKWFWQCVSQGILAQFVHQPAVGLALCEGFQWFSPVQLLYAFWNALFRLVLLQGECNSLLKLLSRDGQLFSKKILQSCSVQRPKYLHDPHPLTLDWWKMQNIAISHSKRYFTMSFISFLKYFDGNFLQYISCDWEKAVFYVR